MPTKSMRGSIVDATESYERWLADHTPVVADDLDRKHTKMRASPFSFMRATYYRWVQTFPDRCPDAARAPSLLSVGDLHVNNFGLWRDAEGRLAWGVNDFDEAHPLPYTNDLVRLAVSTALLDKEADLDICLNHACKAILDGYTRELQRGGRAFVLAERNDWIRDVAIERLVPPDRFWSKLAKLPAFDGDLPPDATAALEALLPEPEMDYRIVRRVAGAGSLGRPRFVALAEWTDGRIAREAKAVVPSASVWHAGGGDGGAPPYEDLFAGAVRARDPWVVHHDAWIVRRLAPDCTRIELDSLPDEERSQLKLLKAMGRETANVHLASGDAVDAVRSDLESRDPGWLRDAAKSMAKLTRAEWKAWR